MNLLPSRAYRVGDAIRHAASNRNFILIGETTTTDGEARMVLVTDSEYAYDPGKHVWAEELDDLLHYKRGSNTGLAYHFTSFDKAEEDYQNGAFTPYFDSL